MLQTDQRRAERGDLHVRELGVGSRALVFLHGGALSGRVWLPLVRRFPAQYAQSFLIDLPGCGDSPPIHLGGRSRFSADLDSHAAILDKYFERRGLQDFHLIGHGFGAALALEFAAREGSRVRSLTMVNPPPPAGVSPGVRTLWDIESHDPHAIERFVTEHVAVRAIPRRDLDAVIEDIRKVDLFERHGDRDTLTALHLDDMLLCSIRVRSLVITGDRDHEGAVTAAARIAETIPNAGISVVHRAGHLLPLEAPEILFAIFRDFIQEVEAAADG